MALRIPVDKFEHRILEEAGNRLLTGGTPGTTQWHENQLVTAARYKRLLWREATKLTRTLRTQVARQLAQQDGASQELIDEALEQFDATIAYQIQQTVETATDEYKKMVRNIALIVGAGLLLPDAAMRKYLELFAISSTHAGKNKLDLAVLIREYESTFLIHFAGKVIITRAFSSQAHQVQPGSGLVEVSAHYGARPTHAEWQGQIYQLVGSGRYDNLYDATGYGTGEGLHGWNCRHSFWDYSEGDTPRAAKVNKELNDRIYSEQQKVNYYKRRLRQVGKQKVAAIANKDVGYVHTLTARERKISTQLADAQARVDNISPSAREVK